MIDMASRVTAKGKTRSSLYRDADTPGTMANNLKKLFRRKGEIASQTEHAYFRLPIWGGTDPAVVEAHYRTSMKALNALAASKTGNAAKKKLAEGRLLAALALQAQGMTQKKIAAEIGITDRGLRKLLKRGK